MEAIKTILVPTDFSDAAKNALEYAIVLAKKAHAKLIILNVYNIPLASVSPPYVPHSEDAKENMRIAEEQLKKLELEVAGLSNVDYETQTVPSYWIIEFPEIIQSQNADLTVMGTHGASGLKEIILGSNTASVIESAMRPVLAIPEQAHYKEIKNIGFAYDMEHIKDLTKLDSLVSFAKLFHADISIFHVKDRGKNAGSERSFSETDALHKYFGAVNHSYSEFYEDHVEEGINKYIAEKHIDILTMMPRRRNLFQRLFKTSHTQKMAFHSKIPLLAIPE